MSFIDLTQSEKSDLAAYDVYLRGCTLSLLKIARDSDPLHWQAFAAQFVDPVLSTLADDDIIPNSSGLASSRDLTVAEFKQLQTIMRQLLTIMGNNRNLIVKSIGVNAN